MRTLYKIANILVVDDDPVYIKITEILLQEHFSVHSVTNGHEALEALKTDHFDIVLMDINLGDENMDGIKVMKCIRANSQYNNIKVFAVTAYADSTENYTAQGFDDVYTKPIIKEEMIEAINKSYFMRSTFRRRADRLSGRPKPLQE